ncbi:C-type lectin domain family 2 member B-like [Leptodactylus fuscus]|uniref:C-type lectin domain family 2 member B-like n=1 Tax=Leptodactylus fuscus TaxID=238119 RepID=UPI003F4F3C6B
MRNSERRIPEHEVLAKYENRDSTECALKKIQNRHRLYLTALLSLNIVFVLTIIGLMMFFNTKLSDGENCAQCDDDWIQYRGKCYYYSTTQDTWNKSLEHCRERNATLALIDNTEELDFLLWFKSSNSHWIGLSRTDDNTTWTWANGTLYNESLFNITRLSPNSRNTEHVFVTHGDIRSQEGAYDHKWICTRT